MSARQEILKELNEYGEWCDCTMDVTMAQGLNNKDLQDFYHEVKGTYNFGKFRMTKECNSTISKIKEILKS